MKRIYIYMGMEIIHTIPLRQYQTIVEIKSVKFNQDLQRWSENCFSYHNFDDGVEDSVLTIILYRPDPHELFLSRPLINLRFFFFLLVDTGNGLGSVDINEEIFPFPILPLWHFLWRYEKVSMTCINEFIWTPNKITI